MYQSYSLVFILILVFDRPSDNVMMRLNIAPIMYVRSMRQIFLFFLFYFILFYFFFIYLFIFFYFLQ